MANGSAIFRKVLEDARQQLKLDYAKSEGFQHRGLLGDERSEAFGDFLRSRLPPAFGVSTGEVIDRRDRRTGQLDLIIYDQTVTRALYAGSKNGVYPCESVYAIVEVKSCFTLAEAKKCLTAASKVRKLKPFGEKFIDARTDGAPATDDSHRCMYIVFAYSSDLSLNDWAQVEYDRLKKVSSEEGVSASCIDRLIVFDRGLIAPQRSQAKLADDDPGALFADTFLHLANFVERERRRRPSLSWQDYALPQSRNWVKLKA